MESSVEVTQRYAQLKDWIASKGKVALAFSGGVDSVFLLYAAKEALGEDVLAITMSLGVVPKKELEEAKAFCREHQIRHQVEVMDEFSIEGFATNPPNRCYLCKKALFTRMQTIAKEKGFSVLMEGSNVDDEGYYRPGLLALRELGIESPLKECGFSKEEIRKMSKELHLPTWEKPSMACIASRFVYGEQITPEKIKMVEEAENYLSELGFVQKRVRLHGELARIELLLSDIQRMMQPEIYQKVHKRFSELGFSYVTIDLGGFQSGSMNKGLKRDG